GLALFLAYVAWRQREPRHLRSIAIALLIAAAIGGHWYLGNLRTYGSVFGQTEFEALRQSGGLWHALMALAPTRLALELARGLALMAATFVWAGTWTLAHPPVPIMVPVIALALIPMAVWLWRLPRSPLAGQAPLFLAAPLAAGLVSHQLLSIATGGYI